MVFFVKKSVLLFLLPFLLLFCSSHAKDGLPPVRVGDRKLLGVLDGLVKGFTKGLGKTAPRSFRSGTPVFPNNPRLTRIPVSPSNPIPSWVHTLPEAPEKLTETALKKIGESVVGKLFGADGKRGFRIGWKAGKRYNAVEDRCQNYQPYFNCTTFPPRFLCKNPTLPISLPINCVVDIVEATGMIDRCTEKCGDPQEAPCTFLDDVVSLGNTRIPIENVLSKCSVP